MVSMKDVAESCGVSIATVSKAMNDHSDISEETKQRIRRTAEKMGYFPNLAARALKTNRTYNIGVLYEDEAHSGLTHEYFASVLEGFKAESESRGYDITFINRTVSNKTMSYYEHCKYRGLDGVVVACIDFYEPDVVALVNSSIPTVTIDHVFKNCTSVVSDNYTGMEDILRYLYNMGHRKIAYLHGESDTEVTKTRLTAFYETAASLGLEIPPEYVMECDYCHVQMAAIRTSRLIKMTDRPSCIIYPDDMTAISGVSEIKRSGLSVPGDISVVGYDGGLLSELVNPPLTTIKQNTSQIGKLAAIRLIETIESYAQNSQETPPVRREVVEGELIPGKTVRKMN
ncbi:MAG: LacI family DNA-binding transcriptional regulator [Lachnospiraceae bacterium]|nr:LacI family DNA-binding transcriptional regulator [Lachnospiraceae bacterium]